MKIVIKVIKKMKPFLYIDGRIWSYCTHFIEQYKIFLELNIKLLCNITIYYWF